MSSPKLDLSEVKVVMGVCGSVSSLGTAHLLLWLRRRFGLREVTVILSEMAQRFVTKESLEAVCDYSVVTGWHDLPVGTRSHVDLVRGADVVAVAPATVNLLGKLANGICDSLLTSAVASAGCPVLLAPSTNGTTWNKAAVRRNVTQLIDDGYDVVAPVDGLAAGGDMWEAGSVGDFRRPLIRALAKAYSLGLMDRGNTDGN